MENIMLDDIRTTALAASAQSELFQNLFIDDNLPKAGYKIASDIADKYYHDTNTLDKEYEKDLFISYILWPDDNLFEKEFAKYAKRIIDNYKRTHRVPGEDIILPSKSLLEMETTEGEDFLRQGNEATLPFIRYEALKREQLKKAKIANKYLYQLAMDLVALENCCRMLLDLPLINASEIPLAASYAIWMDDEEFNVDYTKSKSGMEPSLSVKYGISADVEVARMYAMNTPTDTYKPHSILELIKMKKKEEKEHPTVGDKVGENTVPVRVVEPVTTAIEVTNPINNENYTDFNEDEESIALVKQLLDETKDKAQELVRVLKENKELKAKFESLKQEHEAFVSKSQQEKRNMEAQIQDLTHQNESLTSSLNNYRAILNDVTGTLKGMQTAFSEDVSLDGQKR